MRLTATLQTLVTQALGTAHNRIFGLDLLRAVAILITVHGHAAMLLYAYVQQPCMRL